VSGPPGPALHESPRRIGAGTHRYAFTRWLIRTDIAALAASARLRTGAPWHTGS